MRTSFRSVYRENIGAFKALFAFLAIIFLCRFTSGVIVAVVALVGIMSFTRNRPGMMLLCYMLMPMLFMVNNTLRGYSGLFGLLCRVCPVALTVFVVLGSSRRPGRNVLPMGFLYAYLCVAIVSSIGGWCPQVSYLKVLNFFLFLVGIHLGTKNLNRYPADLQLVRNGLLAFSMFIILGSIAVIPFPSIGYSFFINDMSKWTYIDDAAAFIENFKGMKLFSGVTNQSQALSPLAVACVAFTFCDMLFVEQRLNALHLVIIGCAPIVLYMTRSRMALLGFGVVLFVILFYTIPKTRIPSKVKSSVRNMMMGFMLLAAIGMVVVEIKNQSISRWLRKTDDLSSDQRDLSEAVTASRLGLVDENMRDFKMNPMWGMGFQTCEGHRYAYQAGKISMFSAPIEKGVLPTMVLGETGVAGAIVFGLFLIAFFATCASKKYICSASLMIVMLFTNMGEASFFSPGGLGGGLWVILVGGGFTLDMIMLNNRQNQGASAPAWYPYI